MSTTARRGSSPDDLPGEWAGLLRSLPGYDPFHEPAGSWFDPEAAQFAIDFIGECIRHVEGDLAGTPFVLERWQRAIVANLFGWLRMDEKGRTVRRFREALIYVPRKNGKTPLAAALAILVLFCDDEKAQQNYIAAADREQAGLLYRQAKGMVDLEPELAARCRAYGGNASAGQSRSLVKDSDTSFLRVISADADTKHGGNSHLVLIDELHAQPNRDLVDVLQTSMASANRKQPLLVCITTADYDRPSICNEKHEYACKVRDGVIDDPSFLPVVYEAGKDDDWSDPATWRKANPNLGVSVSEDYLRRECQRAKDTPAYEFTFRRLHLNQKTGTANKAIDLARWDACAGPVDPFAMEGRECWGGLDLSTTTDLTAFALVFREGDGWQSLAWFWAPEERARHRSKMDRVPYLLWAEQGWITLTPGDVTDYDRVRSDIRALGDRYNIREIAADRWNATQLITQLQGDGFNMVAFGQGFASMTAPTKELLSLVVAGRIAHGGNPVLRWMAGNLAIEQDAAENAKPSKKRSSDRIDGVVAVTMALGRAMVSPGDGSIYDTQEITVL